MKYLIHTAVLFLFTLGIQAQSFVDAHFQDLVDADESTVISVSGEMFKLAAIVVEEGENEDGINSKELLGGIKSLQFVAMDEIDNAGTVYRSALKKVNSDYEELMSVKSKDGNVKVFIDEEDGIVYEIIAMGTDDDNFFVGSILAEIKLEDLSEVIGKIQKNNWKALDKFSDIEMEDLKVYPNPASTNTGLTIDVPEGMIGGTGILYDAKGAVIKNITIGSASAEISIDGLTPGNYVLAINQGEITLKKKVLIVK